MLVPQKENLAARKLLLSLLLALIVGAILYNFTQNRPWNIPESAKQLKNPVAPSPAAITTIRPIYLDKCASCHGESGKGDGHDATLYDPPPTNFTDATTMRATTDGELFYKLTEGRKPMPSFKRRLTDEQRWQMILLVRSFAAPNTPVGPSQ